jgi:hypothetical protein
MRFFSALSMDGKIKVLAHPVTIKNLDEDLPIIGNPSAEFRC